MGRKPRPIAERFWEKVAKRGHDDCWVWFGSIHKGGYGYFGSGGHRGKIVRAHRVAWELTNGPVPEGLFVLRDCDNPPCCNPKHLYLGTHLDNMADQERKGRRLRGEAHGSAKLNECDVRNIRIEYAKGDITMDSLATFFNVGQYAIAAIVSRKSWGHLP